MPVYNPRIFDQPNEARARAIILTPEAGLSPEARWASETPYLDGVVRRIMPDMGPTGSAGTILDFGCGVGRMACLADRYQVIGVDISPNMRRMAAWNHAANPNFSVMSDVMFDTLAGVCGLQVDMVLAFWALQHVANPGIELLRIRWALPIGGYLVLLNRKRRCVPTYDAGWWDDGLDIFGMVEAEGFYQISELPVPPGLAPADNRLVVYQKDDPDLVEPPEPMGEEPAEPAAHHQV